MAGNLRKFRTVLKNEHNLKFFVIVVSFAFLSNKFSNFLKL